MWYRVQGTNVWVYEADVYICGIGYKCMGL